MKKSSPVKQRTELCFFFDTAILSCKGHDGQKYTVTIQKALQEKK